MASSREGFPMVIMEAMIHGAVPISTNVGGISENIINKQNGILIDAVDEIEIVTQLLNAVEYYANNRNELKKISRNAYEYAKQHFNKQNFIQAYKKLLNG
jgi:glycosyltransferase involved in cell wall biosynthesis